MLKFWIQAENFTRNLLSFNNSSNIKTTHSNTNNSDEKTKKEIENLYKQWQNDAMVIYDKLVFRVARLNKQSILSITP